MMPIVLAVLMAFSYVRKGPTVPGTIFFSVAIVGWIIFLPLRFDALVRQHTLAQMRELSYSKTFGDYQLEVTHDGLVSTGPTGRSEHTWASVDRITLTPDYLFVFFAGLSGLPIPVAQIGLETAQESYEQMQSYRSLSA